MISLPTPHMERWKYSNLHSYVQGDYVEEQLRITTDCDKAYIHNDHQNIHIWAQDKYQDMQLWLGNKTSLSIKIPMDIHVDKPVYISSNILKNNKSSGNIDFHVSKGAECTLIDDLTIDGWCNRSMTIVLDEGAKLTHIRFGSGDGIATNLIQIQCANNAQYNGYTLDTYGQFVRDQIHATLNGSDSVCSLSGAKILRGDMHHDTSILIEHLAPNCKSNQNYRNVLDGQSRGVFQGKVYVSQIAQKTDGYQLCNSVLLSDRAEMDTKPELEIYADDVKCSHGATTAQMDEEPLFYLMARGIPESQAKSMLLQAFVQQSLQFFEEDDVSYSMLSNKIEGLLND